MEELAPHNFRLISAGPLPTTQLPAIIMKALLSTLILLSAGVIARAQLVGLDFNSGSGDWEYRTVNAATGATTSLNTFPLSSGLTDGAFVTDPSGGSAYIISGSGLYHLNLGTGSVLGTSSLDTSITSYGLSSGGLAGVAFNSGTGNWEYRSINSVSGVTTLLNTFTLANGLNDSSFADRPLPAARPILCPAASFTT